VKKDRDVGKRGSKPGTVDKGIEKREGVQQKDKLVYRVGFNSRQGSR
jgi:hypothetical protein